MYHDIILWTSSINQICLSIKESKRFASTTIFPIYPPTINWTKVFALYYLFCVIFTRKVIVFFVAMPQLNWHAWSHIGETTVNKKESEMWHRVGVHFFARRKFLFLFPKQYIMSLADPIFSFTLPKNTLKVPTRPTLLIWSTHLEHRASAMQYPPVLPAAPLEHSPPVNPLPLSVYTCLQRGHWSQSHKTWKAEIFPAACAASSPAHAALGQRARLSGRAFPPSVRPRRRPAKGAARGNTALFCEIYFLRRAASPGPGCKSAVFRETQQFRS